MLSNSELLRENGIPIGNTPLSFDDALNIAGKANSAAGFYGGYKQCNLYIEAKWNDGVGKWKGKNGVWYMEKVEGKGDFLETNIPVQEKILLLKHKNMTD